MIRGRQLEEYILQQGVVDADMPIVVNNFCSLYACTIRLNIVAIDFLCLDVSNEIMCA